MNHRKVQRMGFRREQHGMTRVDIETGIPFEEFVAALEKAAPPVDQTTLERISAVGGNWDDVLAAAPETLNESPHGNGWLVKIRLSAPTEVQAFLSAADYGKYVAEEESGH